MTSLFLTLLAFAGMLPLCIGILTIIWWFKAPPEPNDQSNRLNNIASWWIGLTRPQVLGKAYRYFRQDLMDNVHSAESSLPPVSTDTPMPPVKPPKVAP